MIPSSKEIKIYRKMGGKSIKMYRLVVTFSYLDYKPGLYIKSEELVLFTEKFFKF